MYQELAMQKSSVQKDAITTKDLRRRIFWNFRLKVTRNLLKIDLIFKNVPKLNKNKYFIKLEILFVLIA